MQQSCEITLTWITGPRSAKLHREKLIASAVETKLNINIVFSRNICFFCQPGCIGKIFNPTWFLVRALALGKVQWYQTVSLNCWVMVGLWVPSNLVGKFLPWGSVFTRGIILPISQLQWVLYTFQDEELFPALSSCCHWREGAGESWPGLGGWKTLHSSSACLFFSSQVEWLERQSGGVRILKSIE